MFNKAYLFHFESALALLLFWIARLLPAPKVAFLIWAEGHYRECLLQGVIVIRMRDASPRRSGVYKSRPAGAAAERSRMKLCQLIALLALLSSQNESSDGRLSDP